MPDWRRYYVPDATVFITGVTRDRIPYLGPGEDVDLFWRTARRTQEKHPFRLLAHVTLPDHFHWLLLPRDPKGNFSAVLHSVKLGYTQSYKRAHRVKGALSIWQRGFWDHIIWNEDDLARHFDYIHWNPVKHGYVPRPEAWPYSTYRHWLSLGYYEPGWGDVEPEEIREMRVE